jgi:SAM-dependent methyltransferase
MSVADLFKADFEATINPYPEFPVTMMSSDLARAIGDLPPLLRVRPRSALDVGTGSGLHASALAVAGIQEIDAVDIAAPAVAAAQRRFFRLRPQLDRLAGTAVPAPRFTVCDMEAADLRKPYDLIVANPPSFFPARATEVPDTPITRALFDGDRRQADNVENSFLYRLFARCSRGLLADGGTIICTWPAIEARLTSSRSRNLVHPLDLLSKWFGWQFGTSYESAEAFFRKSAQVRGYGSDDRLVNMVAEDARRTRMYSETLAFPEPDVMIFRYGILCIEHVRDQAGHFRIINI